VPSTRTLDTRFRPFADALLALARRLDKRFVITSARRSRTDQQRLYNRWLAGQSPFPALPPGKSRHELGLAVDLARRGVDPSEDELLVQLGAEWRKVGGGWGGAKDPVHFESPKSWG